jgi:HEAT repeat protein
VRIRSIGLLALVSTLSAGAPALDLHPWSDAVKIKTRHFRVETNTSREFAASLAASLEAAYPLFESRFGPLEGRRGAPMHLQLFRTQREYMEHGDGVAGAVGHYDAAADRCSLAWLGDFAETGWPIAVHEASHHYLRRRYPYFFPPSWYGEGIACYFEGLQDPTSAEGIARKRVRVAQSVLREGKASLAKLLESTATVEGGTLRLSGMSAARFYALSWSLIHYLATDPSRRADFRRFEVRLFASRSGIAQRESHAKSLLEQECGPLAELERGWHAHLRALGQPAAVRLASVAPWELSAKRTFTRLSALSRLAYVTIPEELRKGVVGALFDSDIMVRTAAARLVKHDMGADAVPGLVAALDAGDPELKTLALQALAHADASGAVERLIAERDRRDEAVTALCAIDDERTHPALREALLDRSLRAATRARCAQALRGQRKAYGNLVVATYEEDPEVRKAARGALESVVVTRAMDAGKIVAAKVEGWPTEATASDLNCADDRRAWPAALALGPDAGPVAVGLLIDVLKASWASNRFKVRACRLLGDAKTEAAVPHLKRLCHVRFPDRVRLEAVRSLVKITGETRGFVPGQRPTEREAAYRAWASK